MNKVLTIALATCASLYTTACYGATVAERSNELGQERRHDMWNQVGAMPRTTELLKPIVERLREYANTGNKELRGPISQQLKIFEDDSQLPPEVLSEIDAAARVLKYPSLDEIHQRFERAMQQHPSTSSSPLTVIVAGGVNALQFPDSPYSKDSVQVVASQFNDLESKTPAYTPISGYPFDRTQGPSASLSMLKALVVRDYAVRHGLIGAQPLFRDLLNQPGKREAVEIVIANAKQQGLSDELAKLLVLKYCDGYLMPYNMEEKEVSRLIENNGQIRLFAQTEARITQVFCAAPSFQDPVDSDGYSIGSFSHPEGAVKLRDCDNALCEALVTEQFVAAAELAALKAIEQNKTINLHIWKVGQGVFENPPKAFETALGAAIKVAQRSGRVQIFAHVFNVGGYNDEVGPMNGLVDAAGVKRVNMSSEQFFAPQG